MSENSTCVQLARLPIVKMQDVLLARFLGRDIATKLGFSPETLTRFATAISEVTRNVVQHAGAAGDMQIGQVTDGDKSGLRIVVTDPGKGIDHPERFLDAGSFGAIGAGLAGTQRLVDQFQIESVPGSGTTVTMVFWKPQTRPSPGETAEDGSAGSVKSEASLHSETAIS
jgi:serine/threonine-protein kinase RsbT